MVCAIFVLLRMFFFFFFKNVFDRHFWSRSNLLRHFNATIISHFGSTSKNELVLRQRMEIQKKNTTQKEHEIEAELQKMLFFLLLLSLSLPSNSSAHCFAYFVWMGLNWLLLFRFCRCFLHASNFSTWLCTILRRCILKRLFVFSFCSFHKHQVATANE